MQRSKYLMLLALGLAVLPSPLFARGFGGFGGGGFRAGGFEGGGFHAGGFEGGGFDRGGFEGGGFHAGGFEAGGFDRGGDFGGGGFRAGGYDAGGFRAGGYDAGGFRAGGFDAGGDRSSWGGSVDRSQLGGFLGLPTDGGASAAAVRGGASYHSYEGANGGSIEHGTAAVQGAAIGPGGAAAGGRMASGTQITTPGGNTYTHTTSAGRGIAAGPNGVAGGSYVAGGSAYRGADGGAYARGAAAGRGFAAGPNGVVAGAGVAGTRYCSPTYLHAQGLTAQRWCEGTGVFTAGWCGAHPWAWHPGAYAPGAWAAAAWGVATWPAVGTWFGDAAGPVYQYDYGDNITYQDGSVYYGQQYAGTQQQYYQEAADLASSPAATQAPADADWLPLGVFGLIAEGQSAPQLVFQLAVDKTGSIRGNYYDQMSDTMLPVTGAVNKKDQRVAWHVAKNQSVVIETGLYNLTQDHSTALVHYGPSSTQQMTLVRMKQPPAQGAATASQ